MAKYCVSDERVAVIYSTALGVLIVVSTFAANAQVNNERPLAYAALREFSGAQALRKSASTASNTVGPRRCSADRMAYVSSPGP